MKKLVAILFIFNLLSFISTPLIHADENVAVSVPPSTSNFQFSLSSSSPQPLQQGEDSLYQITYGAQKSAAFPTTMTIVASWDSNTAPDNSQMLDYEEGSATNGYADAAPVIDLTNKTITWTIYNLPAGTMDQTVSFKLRIITSYSKPTPFNFNIRADMNNEYVTLPEQILTQTYQYKTSVASTPQPTAEPTATVSPTPTPTPAPHNVINTVALSSISDSATTLNITTAVPTKLTILYGTSPNALVKTIVTNTYTLVHSIPLNRLEANTDYYFKAITTDSLGEEMTSEAFTFHTAKQSALPNVESNFIVLSSNGNVFASNSQQESDLKNQSIILTDNTDDAIAYTLTNPIDLKAIDIIVTNKVLGTNTFTTSNTPSEYIFPMQEKTSTLYIANLTTIPQGVYDVDVRIADLHGNIIQKHITDLKIMPRLIVYGADTHTPLSDARIYISYYDEQTKSYQPITSALFGTIKNPSYTDTFGQSPVTLPAGRYRIEESSLFYDPQVQDFTIGPGPNQNFPVLYLKRDPFNLVSLFIYTKDYFGDSWTRTLAIIVEASSSIRIFHLVDLAILVTFVCLTFFLFLFRSHLSFKHLPIFIFFHLDSLFKKHEKKYIFGSIIDDQNNPITRVRIEIEDAQNSNILAHGESHKSGKFYFINSFANPIHLIFVKEGFEPATITIDNQTAIPETGLQIKMKQGTQHHETIVSAFMSGLEEGFGMLFEAFLVSSLLLEVFFSVFLSHQITLPFFFALSFINILLWIFYLRERHNSS